MTTAIVLLFSFLSVSLRWKHSIAKRNLTVSQSQWEAFIFLQSSAAFSDLMQTSCCVMNTIQLSPGTNNSGERVERAHVGGWSCFVAPTETPSCEGFV